jgi:hypothetical protein
LLEPNRDTSLTSTFVDHGYLQPKIDTELSSLQLFRSYFKEFKSLELNR